MNTSAAIRAHLSEHGPSPVSEIAKGLGVKNTKVSMSLSIMRRAGIVSMTGARKPYIYALLRDVPPPISKEEAIRRAKERERNRVRAKRRWKGRRPWAEYIAERRAEALRKATERAEAKALSTSRQSATRSAKVQPSARRPFDQLITPRSPSVVDMAQPKPVLMSSQEWEAMGNRVEVLPSNWQQPVARRIAPLPLY